MTNATHQHYVYRCSHGKEFRRCECVGAQTFRILPTECDGKCPREVPNGALVRFEHEHVEHYDECNFEPENKAYICEGEWIRYEDFVQAMCFMEGREASDNSGDVNSNSTTTEGDHHGSKQEEGEEEGSEEEAG